MNNDLWRPQDSIRAQLVKTHGSTSDAIMRNNQRLLDALIMLERSTRWPRINVTVELDADN